VDRPSEHADDAAQVVVEELLRTAFSLGGVFTSLLEDMPEDAFPGEDHAAVLLEMMSGSARPAVEAAGDADCKATAALIGAVRGRILDDLRTVALLAGATE
jgi:hypothetical protein